MVAPLIWIMKYINIYIFQYEFRKHNSRSDGFMNMVDFMIAMGFPPLDPIEPIQKVEVKTEVKAVKKQKMPKFQWVFQVTAIEPCDAGGYIF